MIVVRIMEGLGNQLFQYATARAWAIRNRMELKLDSSSYRSGSRRAYILPYFKIDVPEATEEELRIFKECEVLSTSFPVSTLRRFRGPIMAAILIDPIWRVVNLPKILPTNLYLQGFWAHAEYFREIKDILLREFSLRQDYFVEIQQICEVIQKTSSVAVHFRRGDYINSQKGKNLFGALPSSYYVRALNEVKRNVKSPVLYVFSDEPDWVRKNIDLNGFEVVWATEHSKGLPYLEFQMMRLCRHIICANSTFSWWAAWLNSNSSALILGPERWYSDARAQRLYKKGSVLNSDRMIRISCDFF